MAKKAKRIYEPLERIIITKEMTPKLGYVVADRQGSTGIYGKGQWQIRTASALEDAQEHRFKLVNYDYVLPYSDELWNAFQRLEERRLRLGELYTQLRKGKIPTELQPVVQGFLFAKENSQPS